MVNDYTVLRLTLLKKLKEQEIILIVGYTTLIASEFLTTNYTVVFSMIIERTKEKLKKKLGFYPGLFLQTTI